jgi:LDH2 family malate/lactate/ureidoglycolate dehydrogenase
MTQVPLARLRAFSNGIFQAVGLSKADATSVTEAMIHADLRGHGSHGTTRIPIYAQRVKAGVVKARPDIRITRRTPAFLQVDGDNGPGPVVSDAALDALLATVRETGVAVAAIGHSNHNGPGSYYVERAVRAGCIAIAMTNAPPSMAVFGGRAPALGTNPITFGVPVAGDAPILLDMATSVVARGKIVEAAKRGETIPEGWGLDADGRPTRDSRAAEAGVVLPMSGAKGSGLAIMVEVLAGVLSGGRFAGDLGNLYSDFEMPQDIGHFMMLIDVSGTDVPSGAGRLVEALKATALAEGFERILMPGEIEQARAASADGIDLPENVLADLDRLARDLDLSPISETV